jgi:hypothetical protein
MTTEERLRELSAAATAGPWRTQSGPSPARAGEQVGYVLTGKDDFLTGPLKTPNADFIAYLRNRAEQLADVVAAARALMWDYESGYGDDESGYEALKLALAALDGVE